jgi:hypothetical protein
MDCALVESKEMIDLLEVLSSSLDLFKEHLDVSCSEESSLWVLVCNLILISLGVNLFEKLCEFPVNDLKFEGLVLRIELFI